MGFFFGRCFFVEELQTTITILLNCILIFKYTIVYEGRSKRKYYVSKSQSSSLLAGTLLSL